MNNTYDLYTQFIKPSWAPPAEVFGPVWMALYILIAFSFGMVFLLAWEKKIPLKVIFPFVLNLFFNFIFTFIQFNLQNNFLASVDVLLVLGTLVSAMFTIYPYRKWLAYIQIPYLAWVSFATVLQISIFYLNL